MGLLTLAFSSASIDMKQQHAKREWIKNKEKDRDRFFRGVGGLNRHTQTKQPASRVRWAFQSEVKVQPYSTIMNK